MSNQPVTRSHYWNRLLEEAHGRQNSPYQGISHRDGRYTWLKGTTGIRGFTINSVLTEKTARVEYIFGNQNKKANEAIFDALAAYREKIEEELGAHLKWQRNGEKNFVKFQ